MWKTSSQPLCCLFTLRLFPLFIFCHWLWGRHILDAHDMFYISFVSGEDSSIPLWPMHCHCNCSVIPISLLMNSPLCIVFFFSCCYLVFILLLCHHLSSSPVYPRIYSRCPSLLHPFISYYYNNTISSSSSSSLYILILVYLTHLDRLCPSDVVSITTLCHHYSKVQIIKEMYPVRIVIAYHYQQIDLVASCCRTSFVGIWDAGNHWHRYYNVDHSHMYHGREREDRGTE